MMVHDPVSAVQAIADRLAAEIARLQHDNDQLRKAANAEAGEVEQLRHLVDAREADLGRMHGETSAEIARLRELLRGVGANRYWEGRWRDETAENERLRAENNARRTAVCALYDWYDRDGSVGGASLVFEAYRDMAAGAYVQVRDNL